METPTDPASDADERARLAEPTDGDIPGSVALEGGAILGRHVVLHKLGAGGMGIVYAAYDPELDRKVALKLLLPGVGGRSARTRLLREAQALAKLSHPNVVAIHDVGSVGEQIWVAMEFVQGQTLGRWLKSSQGWRDVVRIMRSAGEGLAAAHAAGLLHRDFKPDNVMVGDDGRVRVMDFGLAQVRPNTTLFKIEESGAVPSIDPFALEVTRAGALVGTPSYMAPEQYGDAEITAAADQFAFCVTLWEALHGERPFGGQSPLELAANVLGGRLRQPPRGRVVPGWLRRVCERGLAVDPRQRWPSMGALLEQLRRDPRARRWRWLAAGAAVITVSVSSLALLSFQASRAERCSGGQAAFVGVWDAERREAAKGAFGAAGVAYGIDTWKRVAPRLDDYASEWTQMHREACEATSVRSEQSAEVLDLRMACLERARIRLRAVTGRLVVADAEAIEHANELTEGLLPLSRCADVEGLRAGVEPPAADEAAAVHEAEEALAEARALAEIGRVTDAQVAIARADAALEEITYEAVRTELRLLQGVIAEQADEHDEAERALQDALHRAARLGQWELLQEAAFELVLLVGRSRGLDAEALRYTDLAQGLAERSGDPVRIGMAHVAVGIVHRSQGRNAEAEAEYRTALAVLEAGLPADHTAIVQTRGNLATVLHVQGRGDEAVELNREVIAALDPMLGGLHPEVLAAHNNLAVMLMSQRRYEEAEVELRAVVEGRIMLSGPASEAVGQARDNLAHALRSQGRLDEAVAEHQAALRILQAALGPDHVEVVRSHNNLGAALLAQGDLEAAEAELRIAVAAWERLRGPEHPSTALARHNLGTILLKQGKAKLAVEPLGRAWLVRNGSQAPAQERARTAFTLARALIQSGGDRKWALELADLGDAAYAEAGAAYQGEHQSWRAWLGQDLAAMGSAPSSGSSEPPLTSSEGTPRP